MAAGEIESPMAVLTPDCNSTRIPHSPTQRRTKIRGSQTRSAIHVILVQYPSIDHQSPAASGSFHGRHQKKKPRSHRRIFLVLTTLQPGSSLCGLQAVPSVFCCPRKAQPPQVDLHFPLGDSAALPLGSTICRMIAPKGLSTQSDFLGF
jgi:hypothetical protein